jgi:hypothetical protein
MARLLALVVVIAGPCLFAGGPAAAVPAPQGYLELCKETRGGLTGTFSFTFAGRTASVTLTPEATQPVCTPALAVPAGQVTVTERAPAETEICGVRTIQPGRLVWRRGASAAVTVPSGGPEAETTVVFCNKPAPKGTIQVCKETEGGLTGTFIFDVAGRREAVTVGAGAGQPVCSAPLTVPAGQVTVTERAAPGTTLCGVRTIPTGRIAWVRDRSAAVSVPTGDHTVVVFCNRPAGTGRLKVCKVAGAGIEPGTPVTIVVRDPVTGHVREIVVRAGECVLLDADFGEGTVVEVTESPTAGVTVESREVAPVGRKRPCPSERAERVCAEIAANDVTVVTFTNRRLDEKGRLRICKVAGLGVAPGVEFTFTVLNTATGAAAVVLVRAGSCVAAGEFADGTELEVTETLPAGVQVAGRQVLPAGRFRLCAPPHPARVCTVVAGGGDTEVRFTNETTTPGGQLKVCKVAGAGIAPDAHFSFSVRNATSGAVSLVSVTAGHCALVGAFAAGTVVEVTELPQPGVEVSSREVVPVTAAQPCDIPQSHRACARIAGEAVTHVTFTNRRVEPRVPVTVCKVAGSPGVSGAYSFTVRALPNGLPQTVTVGVGACTAVGPFSVSSTLEITEALPAGETVAFAVVPADEQRPCPDPAPNRVCVNLSSTGTRVIATNTKTGPPTPQTGTLRVCKVAGIGIFPGTPYDFLIRQLTSGAATPATIAAGFCSSFPGIPAGTTVEVTETLPAGSEVPPLITSDPVSELRTCPEPAPTKACASISGGATTELRFLNRSAG